MYSFDYAKPKSLDEAVQLLAADEEGKPLAGGMTLIPVLKQRLNKPSTLVDLSGLGLTEIKREGDAVVIGAMATHGAIAASEVVKSAIPGLAYLASHVGDRQVRYCGTIGGSLANNDPSACYPAAALALGATIHTPTRKIAAADYFQGMFTTALEPNELITAISFPVPQMAGYAKFPNPASRYAMAGVFVAKFADGVRVAVTGAGADGVFRHAAAEAALNASFTAEAVKDLVTDDGTLNGDIHGDTAYRAQLIRVMAGRAVTAALG
jgi:carbon-monoxide dehydrogenase medium subunit